MSSEEIDDHELVTSDSLTTGMTTEEQEELSTLFDTEMVETDASKIAVLSDVHSNMIAYDAVLEDLENQDYDIVMSLGDLVGYYTQPVEVLEASRDLFDFRVMGNHDFAAIEPQDLMYSTLNNAAKKAIDHNKEELELVHKGYLAQQPMKMVLKTPYGSITAVHGDPLTIFGYIYGKNKAEMESEVLKALSHTNTKYLFVGHTHIQGYYRAKNGKVYLNPGAVGQPRDNDKRAAYAIIDLKTGDINLKRVEYDIDSVVSQVHACSFPPYLGERLFQGK